MSRSTAARTLGDRILTAAAVLAVPVILLALLKAGLGASARWSDWRESRDQRTLAESLATSTETMVLGATGDHTVLSPVFWT